MKRLLRAPALHFLVLGGLLFAFWPGSAAPTRAPAAKAREPIVITAADLTRMKDVYTRQTGLPVTAADEQALIEHEIRDRLLYREALARGLQRHDRSIQWRLASKVEFLEAGKDDAAGDDGYSNGYDPATVGGLYRKALDLGLDRDDLVVKRILINKMSLLIRLQADDGAPDDATLRAYFEAHAADYTQPSQATFTHVFTSRGKRGDRAEADARTLLDELRSGTETPSEAVRLGDAFPLGHHYRARSRRGIAAVFGDGFAREVLAAEPGKWSGPFESAYGWHLVWVEAKQGTQVPEFAAVRSQVLQRYVDEHRNAYLEKTLARLRSEYRIVVERDDRATAQRARGNA
jgi:hypothetical protein